MNHYHEDSTMRTSMLLGAMIAGVIGLAGSARSADHTKDTTDEIKKAVADGKAVLLDVREQSEWDDGHLKDAKLLPLSVLKGGKPEDVAKIVPKDRIVYCHCASGIRSLKAADALQKLGYNVRPMKSGYADLLKAGFAPATK